MVSAALYDDVLASSTPCTRDHRANLIGLTASSELTSAWPLWNLTR